MPEESLKLSTAKYKEPALTVSSTFEACNASCSRTHCIRLFYSVLLPKIPYDNWIFSRCTRQAGDWLFGNKKIWQLRCTLSKHDKIYITYLCAANMLSKCSCFTSLKCINLYGRSLSASYFTKAYLHVFGKMHQSINSYAEHVEYGN